MKNLLTLMTAVVLAACSHKPPQPYGKFFPINQMMEMQTTQHAPTNPILDKKPQGKRP